MASATATGDYMSNAFDFQSTNVSLALDVLFPTNVYPGSGIGIVKQGPSWTINLDVASLPENTSATPPSNFYFPAWDTGTQAHEKVRLDNMIAAATGLDTRKAIGDANYNILTTDRYVAIASALTANRLITLPPASSVPGGREVLIQDEIGTLGPTHYVTIQPTGSDTIDGTQARVLGIPYAGLRVRSDGVGRWSYVNAFAVTKIADANYTANPDDRVIDMTALTAARVVTLPAAIAYPAGQRFTLYDQAGQCSATNTLRLAPAGADLINGSASPAIATLVAPYAYIGVISDGVSRWTVVDGGNVTAGTTILSTQISDSSPLGRSLLTQTTAALDRTSLGSTAVGDALFTAASQAAAQSTLGLGTMAVENSNAVSISGGSINGVSVGSVTPGVGTFTTLTANGAVTANGANAAISLAPTGTGAVTINPATAGHIDNMIIGATTPAAATVTSMNGGQLAGMRNKIINGDFRIDQRYAGSGASAVVGSTYFCDRWGVWSSQAGHQNGAGHNSALVLAIMVSFPLSAPSSHRAHPTISSSVSVSKG